MRPVMRTTTSPRRCLASVCAGQGQRWAWEDLNLRPHPYRLNAVTAVRTAVPAVRSRPSRPRVWFNRHTGMRSRHSAWALLGHLLSLVRSPRIPFAAVALGARACLVGRAYLYGLMAGGERGVRRAVDILTGEIIRTLQLLGVDSVSGLERAHVRLRP